MNLKYLIEKHFPFDKFNPGQYEAIEQTIKYIRSGKKHIILSAPTGVGKSVIATTVHKVLRELNSGWRSTIITATKGLQNQYVSQDSSIYDLKGRKNYFCPKGAKYYNSPECRVIVGSGNCSKESVCEYYIRRVIWCKSADLRLTNTSFQIEACPMLVMDPDNRANLIIIDEAHELPLHLVNHSTISLDIEEFSFCKKACDENFFYKLKEIFLKFRNLQEGVAFKPNQEQIDVVENFRAVCLFWMNRFANTKDSVEQGATEELQQIADKLELFCSGIGEWIFQEKKHQKHVFKPVYAHQVANHGIFRKADYFLHMSATICGFDVYSKNLGLNKSEVEIIELDNPIPIENRTIKLMCNVSVSKNTPIKLLVDEIDKIIPLHKNENGVIHTVSFKLANDIKENSRYRNRMLISNNREEIEYSLSKANSGIIILSPSIEKGYDFKGDMARWQIIPKVPFAYIGDPWIKLNMDRDPKWYSREAILRIVQASGRIVRGVEDYGITYILDSNFIRLLIENDDIFPMWYIASIDI